MTISQRIQELMSDGAERHCEDIARLLKCNEASTRVALMRLKRAGILITPKWVVITPKRGVFKLNQNHKN